MVSPHRRKLRRSTWPLRISTFSGGSMKRRIQGMKRNLASTAWVARRQMSATVALSHEVSLAVAARPTMAPAATAAIQSNGANSARVRRSVKRNRSAAVRNSVEALMAASTAPGRHRSTHEIYGPRVPPVPGLSGLISRRPDASITRCRVRRWRRPRSRRAGRAVREPPRPARSTVADVGRTAGGTGPPSPTCVHHQWNHWP